MTDPTNLTVHRWETGSDKAKDFSLIDALEVAMHRLRTGEIKAEHIVICLAEVTEEGHRPYFYQAGKLNGLAQVGLVAAIQAQLLSDV